MLPEIFYQRPDKHKFNTIFLLPQVSKMRTVKFPTINTMDELMLLSQFMSVHNETKNIKSIANGFKWSHRGTM